jgi:hypothetical protein
METRKWSIDDSYRLKQLVLDCAFDFAAISDRIGFPEDECRRQWTDIYVNGLPEKEAETIDDELPPLVDT